MSGKEKTTRNLHVIYTQLEWQLFDYKNVGEIQMNQFQSAQITFDAFSSNNQPSNNFFVERSQFILH